MVSPPLKPWEASTLNSSAPTTSITNVDNNANISRPSIIPNTSSTPPIPPRLNPQVLSNIPLNPTLNSSPYYGYTSSPYNSYGTSYNRFGYGGGYGSYGGYSGFSGYGMGGYGGYGNYGGFNSAFNQPGAESRFIQIAEESSRPAFQSIESIVQSFSSIAMMLDQTFFAMTSSFRAVLSVAESFGRLRSMMQHIWTSFALFKAINWLLRKLMSLLRVYDDKKLQEVNLNNAFSSAAETSIEAADTPSKWPIVAFLGIIISAPYIVSKMIGSPSVINEEENIEYKKTSAAFSFTSREKHELSFNAGEVLSIYPQDIQQRQGLARSGWILAKNAQGQTGVVPVSYLMQPK